MEKRNALLHFFFKEDPDNWDDEKWAKMWARCDYIMEMFKNTGGMPM